MFRFARLAIGLYWTDAPGDKLDIDAMVRDRLAERHDRLQTRRLNADLYMSPLDYAMRGATCIR